MHVTTTLHRLTNFATGWVRGKVVVLYQNMMEYVCIVSMGISIGDEAVTISSSSYMREIEIRQADYLIIRARFNKIAN